MANPKRRLAASALVRGATQAEAGREAGVNRSTVKRWLVDPAFQELISEIEEDFEEIVAAQGASLSRLVPEAYALLEKALRGDAAIPAAKAAIALSVLKAAAISSEGEAGESPLEKRLAELDAAGNLG